MVGEMTKRVIILGLGLTGWSLVRYAIKRNYQIVVMDTRSTIPQQALFQTTYPQVKLIAGHFDLSYLHNTDEIYVSPSISLDHPFLLEARELGIVLRNDIDLFTELCSAPIIAVTGSNGKTTVTTQIAGMLNDLGQSAIACGNIGVPVLDLLEQPAFDYYVMELSSFQLELVRHLKNHVAVLLNISPDHLDHHKTMAAYLAAKQNVYHNCAVAIVNADEPEIWQGLHLPKRIPISLKQTLANGFYYDAAHKKLCYGEEVILDVASIKHPLHQLQNDLSTLAVASALRLPLAAVAESINKFIGLKHRCQLIHEDEKCRWYNDSKATNVGASVAALNSLATLLQSQEKIILIAGGQAKGQDFSLLQHPVKQFVRHIILMGEDRDKLKTALLAHAELVDVTSLHDAVVKAKQLAHPGDIIVLSPACASFDMFRNYEDRGDQFVAAVKKLQEQSCV